MTSNFQMSSMHPVYAFSSSKWPCFRDVAEGSSGSSTSLLKLREYFGRSGPSSEHAVGWANSKLSPKLTLFTRKFVLIEQLRSMVLVSSFLTLHIHNNDSKTIITYTRWAWSIAWSVHSVHYSPIPTLLVRH